jgi:predicted  nucleic acid-binding Zn-ribbon protein
VHPDLVALLALQDEDTAVAGLESRRRDLDLREQTLDQERSTAEAGIARTRQAAEAEDKKRRELGMKLQEHRALQERHLVALDAVRKDREASAAMSQIEITRRVLAQEESEMQTLATRISDLNQAAELEQLSLGELEERQRVERAPLWTRSWKPRVPNGTRRRRASDDRCSRSTSAFADAKTPTRSMRCAVPRAAAATPPSRSNAAM